jgi:DNA-binding Lrp family transcriptional regulator
MWYVRAEDSLGASFFSRFLETSEIFTRILYMTKTDFVGMTHMTAQVKIDEVDVKILRALVADARTKLKDIAKECGLSSTAILNRVKRLKAAGVIVGSVLFLNMNQMGFMYAASIGMNVKIHEKEECLSIIRNRSNVLIVGESAGSNTLRAFVQAKSLKDLDNLKQSIRNQLGSRKISVNLWGTPQFLFDNIELEP